MVLRIPLSLFRFTYGVLTLSDRPSQSVRFASPSYLRSYNPVRRSQRFRLLRFRSPLLTEYLSVPRATEMFQFTRFPRPKA